MWRIWYLLNFLSSLQHKETFKLFKPYAISAELQSNRHLTNIFQLHLILNTMPAIASSGFTRNHRLSQTYHHSLHNQDITKLPLSLYWISKGPRDVLLDMFSSSPSLQSLAHSLIENEIYVHDFRTEDWMYSGIKYEQGRVITYYRIRPSIARQMWKGVVNLARLAICAATNSTWEQVPRRAPGDPVYPLDVLHRSILWYSSTVCNSLNSFCHMVLLLRRQMLKDKPCWS